MSPHGVLGGASPLRGSREAGSGGYASTGATVQALVQVCGRHESLPLARDRVSIRELTQAVERRFEVRPPFLFVDQDGHPLKDDDTLAACVGSGGMVLVKLTEGVLHDFGRRVDQIRHLQWGYFSDRLAAVQQEGVQQRQELQKIRAVVEQEQRALETGQQELYQSLTGIQEALRKEKGARDGALHALSEKFAEKHEALQQSHQQRDIAHSTVQRGLGDLQQGLEDERRNREHFHATLGSEREEHKRMIQQQAVDREEGEARLRREVQDSRAAAEAAHAAWRSDGLDVRQQLAEIRQAMQLEQRERTAADDDARDAAREAQRALATEVAERQAESHAIVASLKEMETALAAAKADAKRMQTEFGQQFSNLAYGFQDEKTLRAQEQADFARQLEQLRRSLEHESSERGTLKASLLRAAQEFGQRCDDEAQARDTDVRRLQDLMSDEVDQRQEGYQKLARIVSDLEGGGADAERRARDAQDMQQALGELKSTLRTEQGDRLSRIHEDVDQRLQHHQRSLDESMQRSGAQEVHSMLGELRAEVEAQRDLRERDRKDLAEVKRGLAEQSPAASSGMKPELLHPVVQDLQGRLEQTYNEIQAQAEALAKLREDCKEAMQREVRSRMEHDAVLQEALELEAGAREKAIKAVDAIVSELQQGLETHTHELHVDGLAASALAQQPQLSSGASTPHVAYGNVMERGGGGGPAHVHGHGHGGLPWQAPA